MKVFNPFPLVLSAFTLCRSLSLSLPMHTYIQLFMLKRAGPALKMDHRLGWASYCFKWSMRQWPLTNKSST